jgi:hypothetical protein
MDRAEIEERLIAYADRVAAETPIEVYERNGVEIGHEDFEHGAVQIVSRPVALKDDEREAIREILGGEPLGIFGLRDDLRAHVLYGLWIWEAEVELIRGVVATVWQHDYREIFAVFQRRQLRALFDAARFPIDHLPERVTIYRGIATKGSERPSHSGIAWTLRRDLACWFALHLPHRGGSAMFHIPPDWTPHLLTATVPRKRVAAHLRDRDEDEIIIFGMSSKTASVTSDEDDIRGWRSSGVRS